ncbi:MAG: nucleoside triphosphate pyrophosphohydrolase [Candidatus Auribacterota bacterium]|jgi:tetrapyrrole methylase family protein/MazG family protein|nr:nucleoside triphosphate pyrophosphohydrolase [Candidatus Auribacterota bacterium]
MNTPDHPLDTLAGIMKKLRSPEGCPWDKEQSHETIKRYIIEEVYEFVEAVEENNPAKMKDELGDLLFQIIFHCQLAEEENHFSIYDVIKSSAEKMIRRHPHVFGDKKLDKAHEVIDQWEKIKADEHHHKERVSILDGIPSHLPSLIRAYKAQKKVARVGFDWSRTDQIIEKIEEELRETKDAIAKGSHEHIKEEIGDLFFVVANLARFLNYDPEELSRKAVDKFIRRFRKIELELQNRGSSVHESTLEEMDEIWNLHKKSE